MANQLLMEQQLQTMMDPMLQLEEKNTITKKANPELTHRMINMVVYGSTAGGNLSDQVTVKTKRLFLFEIQEQKREMTKEAENFKVVIRTTPGIPAPSEHSTADTHILSPFVDRPTLMAMSKRNMHLNFHNF